MDYLAYHRNLEAVFVSLLTEITAVQIGAGCFTSATNLITAFFWWMLNKVAHANTIPAIPENRKLPADSELIFIEVATGGFRLLTSYHATFRALTDNRFIIVRRYAFSWLLIHHIGPSTVHLIRRLILTVAKILFVCVKGQVMQLADTCTHRDRTG